MMFILIRVDFALMRKAYEIQKIKIVDVDLCPEPRNSCVTGSMVMVTQRAYTDAVCKEDTT